MLVRVRNNRVNVPLENADFATVTVDEAATIGSLSPVREVYRSDDVICSILADEVIQKVRANATTTEDIWSLFCLDGKLSESQLNELRNLIEEYKDAFVTDPLRMGQTSLTHIA